MYSPMSATMSEPTSRATRFTFTTTQGFREVLLTQPCVVTHRAAADLIQVEPRKVLCFVEAMGCAASAEVEQEVVPTNCRQLSKAAVALPRQSSFHSMDETAAAGAVELHALHVARLEKFLETLDPGRLDLAVTHKRGAHARRQEVRWGEDWCVPDEETLSRWHK